MDEKYKKADSSNTINLVPHKNKDSRIIIWYGYFLSEEYSKLKKKHIAIEQSRVKWYLSKCKDLLDLRVIRSVALMLGMPH